MAAQGAAASIHTTVCDYCRTDITQLVRIKCATCEDFDLCVNCFSLGNHVAPHSPDHPYRVVDHVRTPLWAPDWGADEELLLLEALEMFGMGNWSDVAEHVGSKNKTQCETHYADVYCSTTDLLPDPAKALTRDGAKSEKAEEGKSATADAPTVKTEDSKRSATPSATTSGRPNSATTQALSKHAHAISKPKPKNGLGYLVGYIPNRGDFDTEWENDAELTLADMEFKDEDTKWERDLKLKVIEIYNTRLDGRAERKEFVLARGLLERKEKKRNKEEREQHNNMRVFARFHSKEEHEAYVQGIINETRLRKRIEQLQNWRMNGIRSLSEGDLYEAEKRKREAQQGGKKGMYDTPGSGAGVGKQPTVGKKRSAAEQAADEERAAKARKEAGGKGSSAAAAASASASAAAVAAPVAVPAASSSSGAPAAPDWDVAKMPGNELLSAQERTLISTLQLLPQHYLMLKERLIRECLTRGFLKEGQAKQLIKIDVNKTAKFFDFFVSVGWLNTQDLMTANIKQQQQQTGALPPGAAQPPAALVRKQPAAAVLPPPSQQQQLQQQQQSRPPAYAGQAAAGGSYQQPPQAAPRFS